MLAVRRGTRFRFSSPFSSFLFKTKRGQSQEFRDGRYIPVGAGDTGMPKIGAQFGKVLLDVDSGAIPSDERLDGKSVPKVVQPRASARIRAAQSYLA
jgi:hypothetical protein